MVTLKGSHRITSHDAAQIERSCPRAGCWLTPWGGNAKCTVRAFNWRWVLRRHVPMGHSDSGDATLTRGAPGLYFFSELAAVARRILSIVEEIGTSNVVALR